MTQRHIELRHIVDVDGQLIGMDAAAVRLADLLKSARRDPDRLAFIVRAGTRTPVDPSRWIYLNENEVLFLETEDRPSIQLRHSRPLHIAA